MISTYIKRAVIIPLYLLVNSCGLPPQGHLGHSTNTQVVLSEANYMVINTVRGQASATLVLGVGPFNSRLYSRAKRDLLENANLAGGGNKSRALINITTDEQIRYFWFYFPFWCSKTVYITADVIEFKEN